MAQNQVITADPRTGTFPPVTLTISNVNEGVTFDVGPWDYLTIQMYKNDPTTLGSLVLKIRKSNSGSNPVDFATATTLSAVGMTELLCVTAVKYAHADVTTAGTSGDIILFAQAQKTSAFVG